MQPLEKATIKNETKKHRARIIRQIIDDAADQLGTKMSWSDASALYDRELGKGAEIWMNDTYTVFVHRKDDTGWIHLSIKRNDKEPVTDWRDKQQIKNQIVGSEHEALELYPAESRLIDTANQYHLWCMSDPAHRIPCGWDQGRRTQTTEEAARSGAKQRDRESA